MKRRVVSVSSAELLPMQLETIGTLEGMTPEMYRKLYGAGTTSE
ncbi:hypothetical protein [Cohnella sp.]